MDRFRVRLTTLTLAGAFAAAGCGTDALQPLEPEAPQFGVAAADGMDFTGRIIVLGKGSRLPSDLDARVAAAGGRVVGTIPEIGVAFVEGANSDLAARTARIPGVESAVPDMVLQWTPPVSVRQAEELNVEVAQAGEISAMLTPTDPFFVGLQWAPQSIQAPEAWAAGYTGQGVRVAILDGGIYSDHLDLAPNLDVAASRSFTTGAFNTDVGTFWHGTHVAGIVAAAANGIGTVGIAPNATIIGVKVLHGGSGPLEAVLNGIVYAATPRELGGAGAHVINMSLGLTLPRRELWSNKDFRDVIREFEKAFDRATRYAYQQGVTTFAATGNDELNYDRGRELLGLPGQSQHVIGVSATGPHGWVFGATDFYRPAYYTDHGKAIVDVAAPGGTDGLYVVDGVNALCAKSFPGGSVTRFCDDFDRVLSTVRGTSVASYNWAHGTSMASPAAAGVAALIIERAGGSLHPAQVESIMKRSAIDLGKPGFDEWYGHGWVNALRAVQ